MENSVIKSFKGRYDFLSNLYRCDIEVEGIVYPSVEHAFQALKSNDPAIRKKIAETSTASTATFLGKNLKIKDDWDIVRVDVMRELLRKKFAIKALRDRLLSCGDVLFVEGNTYHDNFWGSCTCPQCGNKGKNMLGTLLHVIRWEIKKEMGNV